MIWNVRHRLIVDGTVEAESEEGAKALFAQMEAALFPQLARAVGMHGLPLHVGSDGVTAVPGAREDEAVLRKAVQEPSGEPVVTWTQIG